MDFNIAIHLVVSSLAIPLGAWVLWRKKGDKLHKLAGRTFSGLILIACISSLGIRGPNGEFSYIHLLTLFTFLAICMALISIKLRASLIQAQKTAPAENSAKLFGLPITPEFLLVRHRTAMKFTYAGLIVAFIWAVALPGRYLHNLFF